VPYESPDFTPLGETVCRDQAADGTLYTGITNNLEKRLDAHNAGSATRYTRARGPVELVFVENCNDKSSALKREMEIKSLPRTKKLALIESAARL
jgi:putative endonuclease